MGPFGRDQSVSLKNSATVFAIPVRIAARSMPGASVQSPSASALKASGQSSVKTKWPPGIVSRRTASIPAARTSVFAIPSELSRGRISSVVARDPGKPLLVEQHAEWIEKRQRLDRQARQRRSLSRRLRRRLSARLSAAAAGAGVAGPHILRILRAIGGKCRRARDASGKGKGNRAAERKADHAEPLGVPCARQSSDRQPRLASAGHRFAPALPAAVYRDAWGRRR